MCVSAETFAQALPLQCVRLETNGWCWDIDRKQEGVFSREVLSMPHLLRVDDDEDILSLLTAFFRKHGHHVSTAATGAEMFAELERQPIDIVILESCCRTTTVSTCVVSCGRRPRCRSSC